MYRYYDLGWNAYLDGQLFGLMETQDAQDGWKDCEEAVHKRGRDNVTKFYPR